MTEEMEKKEKKYEEKKEERKETSEREKYYEKEGHMGDGVFISKRSLWLVAGGALGALAALGIGKASKKIKPALVSAAKEGYAFKEWAAGKYERAKEDIEDIAAEAKHAYHKDLEATAEAVKKEKEIIEKVERAVEKKASRKKSKKEAE